MKKTKFIISLIMAVGMVLAQAFVVLAAPDSTPSITGQVTYVEVVPDESTGITTVLVTIDNTQTVRISTETAEGLNLIYNNGEAYEIVQPLPELIEIAAADVITDEPQHAVGSALATFFSDIDGLTYDMIMQAHEQNGFGVIAQALWMTRKLAEENSNVVLGDGSLLESDIFMTILDLKNGGDYSAFFPDDESAPTNWGQFKKAILDGDKKANLGAVMSHRNENAAHNAQTGHGNGNNNRRDRTDRPNHGNGRRTR